MKLVSINLYSADAKGKILEVNDLVASGIEPLDKAHDGNFIKNVILPDLKQQLPNEAERFDCFGAASSLSEVIDYYLETDPKAIIIPTFSNSGVGLETIAVLKDYPDAIVANAAPASHDVFSNKKFLIEHTEALALDSVASARNYSTTDSVQNIAYDIKARFPESQHVVMKPLEQAQGKGVVILETDKIEEELKYLLSDLQNKAPQNRYDDKSIEEYWAKSYEQEFQIQEFVQSKPTQHNEHAWDATHRYIFGTVVQEDDNGELHVNTKVYGGFAKLPKHPLQDGESLTQKSRISFAARTIFDDLSVVFQKKVLQRSDIGCESVPLSQEQVEQNTKQMIDDMNTLFKHLTITDRRNEPSQDTEFHSTHQESSTFP